jgi:triacylglycerol lipase
MPSPAAKKRTSSGSSFPPDVFQKFKSDTTKWEPYNALALAWASNLAYEQDNMIQQVSTTWGLAAQPTIKGPLDILGFVAGNDQFILIAFRGTINEKQGKIDANNWIVNFDAIQVAVGPAFHTTGRIHNGFARAFSTLWPGIQDARAAFPKKGQSLWITGHSLGGALALVAAAACTFSDDRMPFNGLYTFGQPRAGNPEFCGNCDTQFGAQYFRFLNNEDIVTRVPPRLFSHFPQPDIYAHCGELRYFDDKGQLQSDEHYWNAFLANVQVGFSKLIELPFLKPITDHSIKSGYIDHIAAYVEGGCQPSV